MAPLLLLYNLDTPKGAKIRRMCLPLKIRTRLVPKESYGLSLAALADGQEADTPCPEKDFDDELLLMVHFTGRQLDALLEGFRRHKIPPVALKAVLTETNQTWDSAALRTELMREREAIRQGGSAHSSV